MYFTQEDFIKIENYLKSRSKKDTDFQLTSELASTDIMAIVQQGSNKTINMHTLMNFIALNLSSFLNIRHEILNQELYNELQDKDANTIYIIVDRPSTWTFGNLFPIILL